MKSNSTAFKWMVAGAMAVGALLAANAASAGTSWSVGVNLPGVAVGVGAPGYYAPAPVYAQPAPVYYAPEPVYERPAPVYERPAPVYYNAPPPVYYRPAPVYYAPAPVYYERGRHWRHEGWGPRY